MKKLLALLLAFVLTLSLVACAQEEEASIRRSRSKKDDTSETETAPEETQEVTEEETEEETEEVTEEVVDEAEIYGVTNGRVYENAFFGIGILLDQSWVYATPEEAAEILGMGAEFMGVEDLPNAVQYDFLAMNAQSESVNVGIQKESFFTKRLSDEEFFEASLEVTVGQLEAAGMKDVACEVVELELAGEKRSAMTLRGTIFNVTLYETMVLIRQDGYMAMITITVKDEAKTAQLLDAFYSLD